MLGLSTEFVFGLFIVVFAWCVWGLFGVGVFGFGFGLDWMFGFRV